MIETKLDQIQIRDLGLQPYWDVWQFQKEMQLKRIHDEIDDTLILVEHDPVYTLGKNADENHLLQSRNKSVDVFNIERG